MKQGVDQLGNLSELCTLCGACAQVCPVKIPLPTLINQLRQDVVGSGNTSRLQSWLWRAWRWVYAYPRRYRLFAQLLTKLGFLTPGRIPGWSRYRVLQKPAKKSLSALAKSAGFTHE